jgi:predicted aspartyl protease
VKDTPPLPCKNYFDVLAVEEMKNDSSALTDVSPVQETARTENPRKSKLEKRLPKKLSVGAAEIGPNSLYLRVEIESTDNQRKYGVRALVDSGATGLFIDREYVKSNQIPTTKLKVPIPVFNVDGTANTEGSISEVAELLLRYNGHSERALFCVTGLGKQNLILGHTWLKDHNPEVDWRTGKVEMSRCSPRCCNGCRTEAREERRTMKREAASISACRSGSFPATVEDAEEEETSSDEPTASDIPFDIEEGDRVWATGLIPEAQYVQATSTISQRLAEGFARNSEAVRALSGRKRGDLSEAKGFVGSHTRLLKLTGNPKI